MRVSTVKVRYSAVPPPITTPSTAPIHREVDQLAEYGGIRTAVGVDGVASAENTPEMEVFIAPDPSNGMAQR